MTLHAMKILLMTSLTVSMSVAISLTKLEGSSVKEGETLSIQCKVDVWYEWCTFKHNGKICDFEYKYDLNDVEAINCSDYEGRVTFNGEYEKSECGISIVNATAEDAGEWSCEFEEYYSGRTRNYGDKISGIVTVEVMSSPTKTTTTMSENMLQRLRSEDFNIDTEAKMRNHPFIVDAKLGKLPFERIKRFVYEQYYVARSNQQSCQTAFDKFKHISAYIPFFEFLTSGMNMTVKLHSKMAQGLGLNDLEEYAPRPLCQAYPAHLSKLATHHQPAVLAAALAVNIPVWVEMCGSLYEALLENYMDKVKEEDLQFIKMMATEVEGLDKMAMEVIEANDFILLDGVDYKTVKDGVRILQAFEIMFWDGVYQE